MCCGGINECLLQFFVIIIILNHPYIYTCWNRDTFISILSKCLSNIIMIIVSINVWCWFYLVGFLAATSGEPNQYILHWSIGKEAGFPIHQLKNQTVHCLLNLFNHFIHVRTINISHLFVPHTLDPRLEDTHFRLGFPTKRETAFNVFVSNVRDRCAIYIHECAQRPVGLSVLLVCPMVQSLFAYCGILNSSALP